MSLKTAKTAGVGGERIYKKAKDYVGHAALLVEVHETWQRESKYNDPQTGQPKMNDCVRMDITSWPSKEHLAGQLDPIVEKDVVFSQGVASRDLADEVGEKLLVHMVEVPNKQGGAPLVVFRYLGDDAVVEVVEKFLEAREAEFAAALGGDDIPDFMK